MKKAFTLVELIIVIVIIGILGTISVEILKNTFDSYLKTKELNKLSFKTDLVLNIIASKLQNRIKNSVIAVECNVSLPSSDSNSCINNSNKNFIAISSLDSTNSYRFPVMEWLYTSIYSKRGMWDNDKKHIQPGWSGFVDLRITQVGKKDEYNITTQDSNFTMIQMIDGNWSKAWGIDGYEDVFENNISVLVFSGSDGRGDFEDINNSYGYYDNNATRIFHIIRNSDINLTLQAMTESNSTTVYEGYYIIRGAMALVPVCNSDMSDCNLTLRFNYFPWRGEIYLDGNSSILATHITQFKFREDGGVMRIYICITSDSVKLEDYNLTICKEKVVF